MLRLWALAAALAALTLVAGASSSHGQAARRELRASARCPEGCVDGMCVQDSTTAGLRCLKCVNNLLLNKVTGNCSCPAGKYAANGAQQCVDCPKGSYCTGGDFSAAQPPAATPCPLPGLTTLGLRGTSARACVNLPGWSYSISALGVPSAELCPLNTYSAGLKKQRACVPCMSGWVTTRNGSTSPTACLLLAGYYLKAPGRAVPCPRGEWKSGLVANASCTKCAFGVTTAGEGSVSASACSILIPGYYAAAMSGAIVTAVSVCPQRWYCPGGSPRSIFNPMLPSALSPEEPTIKACPNGLWTVEPGATAAVQCLTPPGYYTAGGVTAACPDASYRADWKPAAEAGACTPCGAGVFGSKTDQVAMYDIFNASVINVPVQTSPDDCYIKPGQGLYYSSLNGTFRARNCEAGNNYGAANVTYGLTPYACRECPAGQMTSANASAFPQSAAWHVSNGDGTGGFTDALACVNRPGYGYDGRLSQQCERGTYSAADTRGKCLPCGYGLTTAAMGAASAAECIVAAGYGYSGSSSSVRPCPIGTYAEAPSSATSECVACPTGSTTLKEGADSAAQCNLCQEGYGGTDCATICGGRGVNATYGPLGRPLHSPCVACGSGDGQTQGFSFQWQLANDVFVPTTIAVPGASTPVECLSEFSQLADGAWWLPLSSAAGTSVVPAASFAECAALCEPDSKCQLVTYDYRTSNCTVRVAETPDIEGSPFVAFKTVPAGYTGSSAWRVRGSAGNDSRAGAKVAGTGVYTFWEDPNALKIGTQKAPAGATAFLSLQECAAACDEKQSCAGFTVRMTVDQQQIPATCRLITGNNQLGVFKRTVVRADDSRTRFPVLLICPSGYSKTSSQSSCRPIETPQQAVLLLQAEGDACTADAKEQIRQSVITYMSVTANNRGVFMPSMVIEVDCITLNAGTAALNRRLLAHDAAAPVAQSMDGAGSRRRLAQTQEVTLDGLVFLIHILYQGDPATAEQTVQLVQTDPCALVPCASLNSTQNVTIVGTKGTTAVVAAVTAELVVKLASPLSANPLIVNASFIQNNTIKPEVPIVLTANIQGKLDCTPAPAYGATMFACKVLVSELAGSPLALTLTAVAPNPASTWSPLTTTLPITFPTTNCSGIWQPLPGNCTSNCGPGTLWEFFVVTQIALWGGSNCTNPLPGATRIGSVACTGSPSICGSCGKCGGVNCVADAAKAGASCTSALVPGGGQCDGIGVCHAPIACVGGFSSWGACDNFCGAGQQTRTYNVTTAAAYGGTACPYAHGYVQSQACNGGGSCPVCQQCGYNACVANATAAATSCTTDSVARGQCDAAGTCHAAVDCVGAFSAYTACDNTCGTGTYNRTYSVSTPALYGGTACDYADGYVQTSPCTGTALVCPACTQCGVSACVANATAEATSCSTDSVARGQCDAAGTCHAAVDCVGAFSAYTACDNTCGAGTYNRTYSVSTPASYGGTACAYADGYVDVAACTGTTLVCTGCTSCVNSACVADPSKNGGVGNCTASNGSAGRCYSGNCVPNVDTFVTSSIATPAGGYYDGSAVWTLGNSYPAGMYNFYWSGATPRWEWLRLRNNSQGGVVSLASQVGRNFTGNVTGGSVLSINSSLTSSAPADVRYSDGTKISAGVMVLNTNLSINCPAACSYLDRAEVAWFFLNRSADQPLGAFNGMKIKDFFQNRGGSLTWDWFVAKGSVNSITVRISAVAPSLLPGSLVTSYTTIGGHVELVWEPANNRPTPGTALPQATWVNTMFNSTGGNLVSSVLNYTNGKVYAYMGPYIQEYGSKYGISGFRDYSWADNNASRSCFQPISFYMNNNQLPLVASATSPVRPFPWNWAGNATHNASVWFGTTNFWDEAVIGDIRIALHNRLTAAYANNFRLRTADGAYDYKFVFDPAG